jgi:hypothetical protein
MTEKTRLTKPFELGKTYLTQAGERVTIIAVNDTPGYETVQGDDPLGGDPKGGWRYNRESDRGRVTGSTFDMSDPRNLIPEPAGLSLLGEGE